MAECPDGGRMPQHWAAGHKVQCGRFLLYMHQRYPREKRKKTRKKNSLTCGWSFKLEPESQLNGLGWITTGFVLMCCGHQIASLLLYCFWLVRGQQVHMDGWKQTHPSWGIPRLQCLIGLEEEVLNTNPTRATQLGTYNYVTPMDRQGLGESFLWHEVKSYGGNALLSRPLLEPSSFSLSQWVKLP